MAIDVIKIFAIPHRELVVFSSSLNSDLVLHTDVLYDLEILDSITRKLQIRIIDTKIFYLQIVEYSEIVALTDNQKFPGFNRLRL